MYDHPISPEYDENSKILILGSFPSVRSRETGFFYGHPANRFWRVLSLIFERRLPLSVPEKKALLKSCHIALWDVIASCDIKGSSDSSITNVKPTDLSRITGSAPIEKIFVNGKKAYELFLKYNSLSLPSFCLPSTSPVKAAWNLEKLVNAWSVIKE